MLALDIEFYIPFTNYPFPLFSDLLLPEEVIFYKNMGFEKQNGAKAGVLPLIERRVLCTYDSDDIPLNNPTAL